MKVLKGYLKGRNIICPKKDIRPLMSILKEYIFQKLENILGSFDGLKALDVFFGSGSFSIEAISQGFSYCLGVEKDKGKKDIIKSNIEMTDGKIDVLFVPCEKFIVLNKSQPFDFIFLDPPFDYKYKNDLLIKLINSDKVRDDTIICIHHPKEDGIKDCFKNGKYNFELISSKNFGRSIIKFFKNKGVNSELL